MNDETEEKQSGTLIFEWHCLIAALGLMTRIPVNWLARTTLTAAHQQRSYIWYPVVGLAIGTLLVVCVWLLPVGLSPLVSAALLLIFWVVVTGALHLDGLADMADAWAGGMGDKQRTLDIMKDPACGPHAVIALILSLLLKYLLILAVLGSGGWILLLIAPMLARSWVMPMLAFTSYSGNGMASDIAKEPSELMSFYVSLVVSLVLLVIFSPLGLWVWLLANLLAGAITALIRYSTIKRIDGYTGDILGAAIELNELALLLGAAFLLSQ